MWCTLTQDKYHLLPAQPAALAADALALALAAGLPLYFPNAFVGLVGDKFGYLLACLMAGAAALAAALLLGAGRGSLPRPALDAAWLWPMGLCACYALAWYFAEDRYTALWGLSGRKNGLMLYLACTAVYLLVAVFGTQAVTPLFVGVLVTVGCTVTVLSWMNYFMLDPLDAYYVFLPDNGELFLGTVGNINFYGALLCLCLPLAAERFFRGDRLLGWPLLASMLLFSGLIPAGSDAAWLGCTAALAVLACRKTTTTHTLARLLILLAGLGGCGCLTWLLLMVLPARAELRTVSAVICRPAALGLAVLCAAGAWLLLRSREKTVYRQIRGAVAAVLLITAAAAAAANLLPESPAALEPLHFTERWAANRGYAWQRLWTVYTEDTTLLQKLIGLGGDAANARLNPDVESTRYMTLLNGEPFDSAHNEFLQHLVCGGLLGLICWCGFLAVALRRGFRIQPGIGAALLGYAVQSVFSISMPGVFPLVFVLAALVGKPPAPQTKGAGGRLSGAAVLAFAALVFLTAVPLG